MIARAQRVLRPAPFDEIEEAELRPLVYLAWATRGQAEAYRRALERIEDFHYASLPERLRRAREARS